MGVNLPYKQRVFRVLQWKILLNIKDLIYSIRSLKIYYPTNILLNKMGLANSDKCSACLSGDKDNRTLFFACTKVKPIWKLVESEIKLRTKKKKSLHH